MASTITTTTGVFAPTHFCNQRKIDRTANGVLWAMVVNVDDSQIEFWWSADNGANWTQSAHTIGSVDPQAGASMRIGTRANGDERMAVVYVRNDHVRVNLARFSGNRQSFSWEISNVIASTAGQSSFWKYPDIECIPVGGDWLLPVFWSRLVNNRVYLWWSRVRRSAAQLTTVMKANVIHERASTIHLFPSVAVRHLGDDETIYTAAPDLYLSWATGEVGDHLPRQYMMRMTARGTVWDRGILRVMREAGVAQSGQVTSACFTGRAFAVARAPYTDGDFDESDLQLHLMDPADAVRQVHDVPDPAAGALSNVTTTWDTYTGDIYIICCGLSDQNPQYIRFIWATQQFEAAWTQINAEGAVSNSITAKPGSRHNRIEFAYAIVDGTDREARYELADTTNTLPSTATWVTQTGAKNRSAALTLEWSHNDPDGDAQSAYTLERQVNGGDEEYWNGSTWQATLVNVSSATQSVTLSSGWATAGDTIEYRVRTSDAVGFGPFSQILTILASTIVDPTITAPADEANITEPAVPVEWDVAEQSAYRLRLMIEATGEVVYDSDWVGQPGIRAHEIPVELGNGVSYTIELTTQNAAGFPSTPQTVDIDVSLTPPPVPLLTLTAVPADGAIDVAIDNGTPGGGEDDADTNDVYRVLDGEETLIAQWVDADGTFRDYDIRHEESTDYIVVARTAAGATIRSDA